jgi:hypothetical protein
MADNEQMENQWIAEAKEKLKEGEKILHTW